MFCNKEDIADSLTAKERGAEDPSTDKANCNANDELYQFMDLLDPSFVDGVVAGHTHSINHSFFNGVPVV